MSSLIRTTAISVLAVTAWAGLFAIGNWQHWWLDAWAKPGDADSFLQRVRITIDAQPHGNIVVVLVRAGSVAGAHTASVGRPVNVDSQFQVASLSKWVTAWGVMTLVESGRVDLDAPVSRYLRRWKLPPSGHDNYQVTVRRLLSHTAGLTDGLGYNGFAPGTARQSLEESLTRAADAAPGVDGAVRTGAAAGRWRYSGGGYAILQLMIEDVSGEAFGTYMRHRVLEPLGMTNSTFETPEGAAVSALAEFFAADGSAATHFRFTVTGAASLYTTAGDLTRFLLAQLAGAAGEPPGRGVLSPPTLHGMWQPSASVLGVPVWGLGVVLYAPNGSGGHVIGHDGFNAPAINTTARLNPSNGDGLIVLQTGDPQRASVIGGEWVYWQAGRLDIATLWRSASRLLWVFAAGALLVVAVVVLATRWLERPR